MRCYIRLQCLLQHKDKCLLYLIFCDAHDKIGSDTSTFILSVEVDHSHYNILNTWPGLWFICVIPLLYPQADWLLESHVKSRKVFHFDYALEHQYTYPSSLQYSKTWIFNVGGKGTIHPLSLFYLL